MLINGEKKIFLFGTTYKFSIDLRVVFQDEDYFLEHKDAFDNDLVSFVSIWFLRIINFGIS
jgi:hypothetical protein